MKELFDPATLDGLCIRTTVHPALPLAILNYDQIKSPKTHPVVRRCRALVVDTEQRCIVAPTIPRFFNWGEVVDEQQHFDFTDFHAESKEDGSLMVIYRYQEKWHINTRSTFATGDWLRLAHEALGIDDTQDLDTMLPPENTYICELVSPENRVVREYNKTQLYLITAYNRHGIEATPRNCDAYAAVAGMLRPTRYLFSDIDAVRKYIRDIEQTDPTYEGMVIRDRENRRWKLKSDAYVALHHFKHGDNRTKRLIPIAMSGERDEVLTYFPEMLEEYERIERRLTELRADYLMAWVSNKHQPTRKDFALAIAQEPCKSLLFKLRDIQDSGSTVSDKDINDVWVQSASVLEEIL